MNSTVDHMSTLLNTLEELNRNSLKESFISKNSEPTENSFQITLTQEQIIKKIDYRNTPNVDLKINEDDIAGGYSAEYLRAVPATIRGGTSEVQRNIIATRGLDLPRG